MRYVIDANNLAGVLGILDEEDFDLQLIDSIKNFIGDKNIQVDLVFDSSDYFGDWKRIGNINVFYTPRDEQYNCADDKIVDIFSKNINNKDNVVLVTDDIELQNRVNSVISEFSDNFLKIEKSSTFALNLFKKYNVDACKMGKCGLSDGEVQEINQEIMEIYGSIS